MALCTDICVTIVRDVCLEIRTNGMKNVDYVKKEQKEITLERRIAHMRWMYSQKR